MPTDNADPHRVPVMEQVFADPEPCCILYHFFFLTVGEDVVIKLWLKETNLS